MLSSSRRGILSPSSLIKGPKFGLIIITYGPVLSPPYFKGGWRGGINFSSSVRPTGTGSEFTFCVGDRSLISCLMSGGLERGGYIGGTINSSSAF
jgi:hypothetical protein